MLTSTVMGMSGLLLIFGLFSGCFVSVLVGLLGAQRTIGFGLSFILSLIFTPVIGLIIVLLTPPLPTAQPQKLGCVGVVLAIIGAVMLIPIFMLLAALVSMLMLA